MHSAEVVITLYDVLHGERRYVFHEADHCVVGRADDCDIQFPSDQEHMEISRHHCLLSINPPRVFISDVGSRNGTFVNGVKIGQGPGLKPGAVNAKQPAIQLKDGDQIHMGKAALWLFVEIRDPALQLA